MKDVVVTVSLKVKNTATIEEVINDMIIDQYGCIEEVVDIQAEVINEEGE